MLYEHQEYKEKVQLTTSQCPGYDTKLHPVVRYYLPTPPLRQDMTQGQFLSGV